MMKNIRTNEYLVFLYRIFLVYLFYTIIRGIFFAFNTSFLGEPASFSLFCFFPAAAILTLSEDL